MEPVSGTRRWMLDCEWDVFHRPLALALTLGVFVSIGGAAWLARYFWTQSQRLPVPRHVAELPSGGSVPGLGPVSLLELVLFIFDGVVLLFLVSSETFEVTSEVHS